MANHSSDRFGGFDREWIPDSLDAWEQWLLSQEEKTIRSYREDPDQLIAAYRRERQITDDYRGREILELLQNANDAAAEVDTQGRVCLALSPEGLVAANTGRPFTTGGVQSLRISDLSPKRRKKSLIGQKGLGFRAVLNWSRRPLILSGSLFLGYSEQRSRSVFEQLVSANPDMARAVAAEQGMGDEIILPALAFPALFEDHRDPGFPVSRSALHIYETCGRMRAEGYDTVIGMPFDRQSAFGDACAEFNLLRPEILLFTDNISELRMRVAGQAETVWRVDGDKFRRISVARGESREDRFWNVYKKAGQVPAHLLEERTDSRAEYEIVIAVPSVRSDVYQTPVLFSFFPTEVAFPYPVVCHATLDLETSRKHPRSTPVNGYIIGETAAFLAEVAENQDLRGDPWCRARLVARTRDLNPLMERLGFKERLNNEAKAREIVPTLAGQFVKPIHAKRIDARELDWLPKESFSEVALPPDDWKLTILLNELGVLFLSPETLRHRLNQLALPDLDSRARLIAGLVKSGLVPTAPAPELLLDDKGAVIRQGSRIYLPPADSSTSFSTPDWLNICFLNSVLRSRLISLLDVQIQRELKQKLEPFEVNEYDLASIAAAIIAEAKLRIDANPRQETKYINETLAALYLIFPNKEDPPKLPETTGLLLPNKEGGLTDSRSLYFSSKYASNGSLLEALYFTCCPENLLASPASLGLATPGDDPTLNRFLKWLGVADLPREVFVDSVDHEFVNYALDSLKYPLKIEDYVISSREDFQYPRLTKVRSVDNLESVLKADPAAILTWLAIDDRTAKWAEADPINGKLATMKGNDRKFRHYSGPLPSYARWKIGSTPWLPVTGNKREKPLACMYGEKGFEAILPSPLVFHDPLFERYRIDRFKLRGAWDNACVLPNVSCVAPEQLVQKLLDLPSLDPGGKSARALYRAVLENIEPARADWRSAVEVFKAKGLMWGKGPEGQKYYPVSGLRHADTDDIPTQIADKIRIVDLPKRIGAQKVQSIFGVEPIDRRELDIKVTSYIESSRSRDAQRLFDRSKPFLCALRQARVRQSRDISVLKGLTIVLCQEIGASVTFEDLIINISIKEPYEFLLQDETAYILDDPTDASLFDSDLFVDSVGAIVANALGLEDGGNFARILRCSSDLARQKLLKKIAGESALSDLEDLEQELDQPDSYPLFEHSVTPPPVSESAARPTEDRKVSTKPEQEARGSEPSPLPGEITIQRENHTPTTTAVPPIALRFKAPTQQSNVHSLKRVVDGDLCETRVESFEASEGRWPLRVSHLQGYQGPRCDIFSFGSESDRAGFVENPKANASLVRRFIEVKGRSSEKGPVTLKGNELDAARFYAERYYIYRLYERSDNDYILLILNNPIEHKEAIDNIIEVDLSRAQRAERYHVVFGSNQQS